MRTSYYVVIALIGLLLAVLTYTPPEQRGERGIRNAIVVSKYVLFASRTTTGAYEIEGDPENDLYYLQFLFDGEEEIVDLGVDRKTYDTINAGVEAAVKRNDRGVILTVVFLER